ncbi:MULTISPECIES: carboxypeptidase regulatory-like domain-containing protein [Streptacidiphilus]|uniref:Carboxypeptidase regulatory-like domain-containing protein n=1 Tax=Streptacidiphilus cavernicola TaxID=3342716 RepID=A0ABV6V0X4_9ACTN|nr:carboxypeptidase regulatory-like domain-containing protein [Streptacidiphilus jeojiense]
MATAAAALAALIVPLSSATPAAATPAAGSPYSAAQGQTPAQTTADQGITQHPVRNACDTAPKTGFARCFAEVRTDVKGHIGPSAATDSVAGYGPADLVSAYKLPSSSTAGTGQTVAVVDAYDDPNAAADLATYRSQYGLPPCTTDSGCFTKVAQDGSKHYPAPNSGWAMEISLDLDMVSATCPNCHILLVEANDSWLPSLGAAVDEAVALGAKYVSNSYGGSEDPADVTAENSYYNHPGIALTVSSGDNAYGVEYPAASQYVTAVGGTSLTPDTSAARGWHESAWSGSGSGCSEYVTKPSWQKDTGCPGRTVADVSAVADPNTGVAIYDSFYTSGWAVVGGTSVSAPIVAGAYALAGTPVAGTYPASYPYANTKALFDVTGGLNGTCTPAYLCTAGAGYDGPTGLGTPNGVAALTTGPHGSVTGTVTNAATGKPITGAVVDAGQQSAVTDAAGKYTLTLPAGSYSLTVKDFGYATRTVGGVVVKNGAATTRNITVSAVKSTTLTGKVTDGSGHGWPLSAKVSVQGTPASTYTDPATGRYTLTLPDNAAYKIVVDPAYTGYQQTTTDVTVGTAGVARDVSVPVDAYTCSAAGYHLSYDGATQTFDSTSTPSGWSVANATGTTYGWEFDNPEKNQNNTGGSGNFAIATSLNYGPAGNEDTELTTPVTDLSKDSSPYLQFDSNLLGGFYDQQSADLSVDGGATWTSVWSKTGDAGAPGPDQVVIPLPTAAGKSQVQVRFHYYSINGVYWELDNVFLGNRTCTPTAGGLAEGTVHDSNTGAGVDGATVTAAGQSTTTGAGPAAGSFSLFLPATGSQQFTAAKTHYVTGKATGILAADQATPVSLTMQAGRLTVSGPVKATVAMGSSTTKTIKLTDTGKTPVHVKLYQAPGTVTVLGANPDVNGAPVQRISGTFSPLPASRLKKPTSTPAPSAQPYNTPWTPLGNHPTTIMDNAAATDPATGLVYSVGGYDGLFITDAAYAYNPATKAWKTLPPMPHTREAAQAAFINGKLYVVGGWSVVGGWDIHTITIPQVDIYDPSTNTWSTGANNPKPYAGAAAAVVGAKLYVVGGCDPDNCGHTDVQIYDPLTNTWGSAARYPESIAWEGCGAISGRIYCAGGSNTTADTTDAFTYNSATDRWTQIASLPMDLWAMSYTAADGKLLLSGGVTNGFSTVTNQGYAYDAALGEWAALPNANTTVYRGGGACGFYRIGGSLGGMAPVNTAQQLPGYADCGTSQVSWLTQSKDGFTVNPGASVTVTLKLNAAGKSVSQPGAYTAQLLVTDDTPYAGQRVKVTMNATPPKTWGKITGTITGLACAGTTPLAGATVQITSGATSYTLKTDANGTYALWLPASKNPLTVIASRDGWQPQAASLTVRQQQTLVKNFALKPNVAC